MIDLQLNKCIYLSPGYSCSCSPFECMCGQNNQNNNTQYYTPNYIQAPPADSSYWSAPHPHPHSHPQQEEVLLGNSYLYNPTTHETAESQTFDFAPMTGDIFQPEEIFQLDQPLRPDYQTFQEQPNHSELANSPPTFIDLGSGAIHKDNFKSEESYWMHCQQNSDHFIISNDDSNFSNSSQLNTSCSPEAFLQTDIVDQQAACNNRLQFGSENHMAMHNQNKEMAILPGTTNYYPQYPSGGEQGGLPSPGILDSNQDPKYFCSNTGQFPNNYIRNNYQLSDCSDKEYRYSYGSRLIGDKIDGIQNIPIESEIEIPTIDYTSNNAQYLYEPIIHNNVLSDNCGPMMDMDRGQNGDDFRLRCTELEDCFQQTQFRSPNHFSQFAAVVHH